MDDIMQFATDHVVGHWPFFTWFLVATLLGEVFKRTLWTKDNATNKKPHWFWWWARKSMVLHPVFAGVGVGFVWQQPEAGVDGLPASLGYFALSGALSVWGYELVKNFLKKKANVNVSLPGLDTPSEPPGDGK